MAGNSTANGDFNLAVFCDFENIALGARDARYARFDIRLVLQKLLLKGAIVVKKAYCDWERYKEFKAAMHEAAFELIEIPHVRQSGKNSADIRMVVDALDLCYTKAHLDTFVIISGDSDFSPLVSKLRENAKTVIGVGVKSSTSDLLMSTCDEFILYDDLVRAVPAPKAKRVTTRSRRDKPKEAEAATAVVTAPPAEQAARVHKAPRDDREGRRQEAIDLVKQTIDALYAERGDIDRLWGSVVKQTLKRRLPTFNESYYGFRSFNDLLEEAQARGQLVIEMDEKSGGYLIRRPGHEGPGPANLGPASLGTVDPGPVTLGPVNPGPENLAPATPGPDPAPENPAPENKAQGASRRSGGRRGRRRPASPPSPAGTPGDDDIPF